MTLKRGSSLAHVDTSSIKGDARRRHGYSIHVGDSVDVHQWMLEGYDKEGNEKRRIQIFSGTVMAVKGTGNKEMFTVRRLQDGKYIERTFPMHSPKIIKVVVKKSATEQSARLYCLRDRVGSAPRISERKKGSASRSRLGNPYHSYLKVNLPEPTGKPTISATALNKAIEKVVSSRK